MANLKLIRTARMMRKCDTWAERLLWRWLRDRRFSDYKFRRQHPFGPHILDFFCLEARLDIELDGFQHGMPAQRFKDVALEEKFEAFKEFVKSHEQDYDWLAIAASLLYLYRNKSNDQTYIFRTLSAKGLPEIRFVEVWKHLEKWGLVS